MKKSQQHIPAEIVQAAMKIRATVGREYSSTGEHVAYWVRIDGHKMYRATIRGMLALLRHL